MQADCLLESQFIPTWFQSWFANSLPCFPVTPIVNRMLTDAKLVWGSIPPWNFSNFKSQTFILHITSAKHELQVFQYSVQNDSFEVKQIPQWKVTLHSTPFHFLPSPSLDINQAKQRYLKICQNSMCSNNHKTYPTSKDMQMSKRRKKYLIFHNQVIFKQLD